MAKSNAEEFRDMAARTIRLGRKEKTCGKVYARVAADYKKLAHDSERRTGGKERSAVQKKK